MQEQAPSTRIEDPELAQDMANAMAPHIDKASEFDVNAPYRELGSGPNTNADPRVRAAHEASRAIFEELKPHVIAAEEAAQAVVNQQSSSGPKV